MTHFIFLCEFIGTDEQKFRQYIKDRRYPKGKTVQVREIKFLDFAVPREIEEEFLKDMAAQHLYDEGEFGNRSKIKKAIGWLIKLFGLEKLDLKHKWEPERFACTKTKFMPIGRLPDHIDDRGVEMY